MRSVCEFLQLFLDLLAVCLHDSSMELIPEFEELKGVLFHLDSLDLASVFLLRAHRTVYPPLTWNWKLKPRFFSIVEVFLHDLLARGFFSPALNFWALGADLLTTIGMPRYPPELVMV